jgi:hypothetical protein
MDRTTSIDDDDELTDAEWDEIGAASDAEVDAEPAFTSEDYETHEEAMAALDRFLAEIFEEAERRVAATDSQTCPARP